MNATVRLAMPFLSAGQAQKELVHNEALLVLDSLVGGAVEEPPSNDPPAVPVAGSCFIVGASPTGDWAGKAGHVAGYSLAGWHFVAPAEGISLLVRSSGVTAVYRDGAWAIGTIQAGSLAIGGQQVVGPQASAIAAPAGGSLVDAEARTAISAILAALRGHGLIAT